MRNFAIVILAIINTVLVNHILTKGEDIPKKMDYNTVYFIERPNYEQLALFIDGQFFDVIDRYMVIENPPHGTYSVNRLEGFEPQVNLLKIAKGSKLKTLTFEVVLEE